MNTLMAFVYFFHVQNCYDGHESGRRGSDVYNIGPQVLIKTLVTIKSVAYVGLGGTLAVLSL